MRCSLSASKGAMGLLQGLVAGGWSDGSLPVPPASGACPGGEQGASGWLGCSVAPTPGMTSGLGSLLFRGGSPLPGAPGGLVGE